MANRIMDAKKRTSKRKEVVAQKIDGLTFYYDLTDLGIVLGFSSSTLQKYIKDGRLKAIKIGGKWKVSEENYKKFINGEV